MQRFDLIVIGGGAGGFGAAIKANDRGARTALVNTGLPLGGTCVNVGCVPSKTLLWAAEVLHTSRHHGIPGLELDVKRLDVAAIVRDELALVDRMRRDKYDSVLRELDHVTFINTTARFIDANTIEVEGDTLSSERFVIATGSAATVPPIPGLREAGFITHIEALRHERLPASVVVIGAGPLGLEFSQLLSRFGVRVTVLQRPAAVFPHTEPSLAQRLTEVLEHEGIHVITGVQVQSVTISGGQKRVAYEVNGTSATADAEEILLAAGKTANSAGLQLGQAGVAIDSRQAITVNRFLQTSAAHIYAVGDVTNAPARVEMTAGHEGTLAAENVLTGSQHAIDYDTVPYTVFTDPQLAGVGLTENEQMKRIGGMHLSNGFVRARTEGHDPETDRGSGEDGDSSRDRADHGHPRSGASGWRSDRSGCHLASESQHDRRRARVSPDVPHALRGDQANRARLQARHLKGELLRVGTVGTPPDCPRDAHSLLVSRADTIVPVTPQSVTSSVNGSQIARSSKCLRVWDLRRKSRMSERWISV